MPRLGLALVMVGGLLYSCAKDAPEPEARPEPEPPPRREPGEKSSAAAEAKAGELPCEARMDRFAARLAPLAKGGAALPVPAEISPIESTRGEPMKEFGPVVVVGRGGRLSLDGERLASVKPDLKERLAQRLERMRSFGRKGPIYIWADQATAAERIAEVAAAVPAELEARLLLAGPKPSTAGYEAELLEKARIRKAREALKTTDPSQKAVLLAKEMEKAVGLCAPLIKVFGAVAGMTAERKGEFIAEAAPKAMRECRCEVADLDMLEYLLLAVFGAFDRPVTWIPASRAKSVLSP